MESGFKSREGYNVARTVHKMSADNNKLNTKFITKLTVKAVASARLKKSFAIYRSRKMREDMTRL